ncbi:MAG: hypothetical protein ACT4OJ_07415 [Bacteroidota bacterium]
MRLFLCLITLTSLLLSASECKNKSSSAQKMKGRLEIAGICMNYTISVLEGNPGADAVVANWTDEMTKKNYTHVFRLGNPCDFPARLKQGDEFYFTIDSPEQKPCMVCEAYYPTPSKKHSIKLAEKKISHRLPKKNIPII